MAETNLVCFTAEVDDELLHSPPDPKDSPSRQRPPPPQYPVSEASGPSVFRPPPSFSSLFPTQPLDDAPGSVLEPCEPYKATVADPGDTASTSAAAPAYAPPDQVAPESSNSASAALRLQDETKRALPQDTKGHAGSSKDDEAEPPPAYSEGSSPPLHSFTYLMAAAGGAASILTQVQQGGPSINPLGDVPGDETIVMDLRYDFAWRRVFAWLFPSNFADYLNRGTRFKLSRDELLTLPEFVLLSLFPNGLFPEGHMGGFSEGDAVQVDVGLPFFHTPSSP